MLLACGAFSLNPRPIHPSTTGDPTLASSLRQANHTRLRLHPPESSSIHGKLLRKVLSGALEVFTYSSTNKNYIFIYIPIMPISLLSLPTELIDDVSSYLGYASVLALQLSCRELRAIVKDLQHMKGSQLSKSLKPYCITDLLEIELWPCYNSAETREGCLKQAMPTLDYFACHICLKIRSAEYFSNAMMKSRRGKLSPVSTRSEKHKRFCIPCGVTTGKYQKGVQLEFGGCGRGRGIVCFHCGQFDKAGGAEYTTKASQRICSTCLGVLPSLATRRRQEEWDLMWDRLAEQTISY